MTTTNLFTLLLNFTYRDEWLNVKAKLGSDNYEEKKRAYQLLLMWKSRCPQLPANIECTLGILQVKINQNWAPVLITHFIICF